MKRVFFMVILAILVTGIIVFQLGDTEIAVADVKTLNNEVTSIISEAGNSSSGGTITITMTGYLMSRSYR